MSVNIPEELYDPVRANAEAKNIAVEDVFASAVADYLAKWRHIQKRTARGDREKFAAVSNTCRTSSRKATTGSGPKGGSTSAEYKIQIQQAIGKI